MQLSVSSLLRCFLSLFVEIPGFLYLDGQFAVMFSFFDFIVVESLSSRKNVEPLSYLFSSLQRFIDVSF